MLSSRIKGETLLWFLLAITVGLQFYRLGIGELIAWDESLYVIRAKAILQFGAWLDQTPYALGGLYSSTHPPLAIWLMALLVKIFGETLTVWRLVAAMSGVAGLFFLYRLARTYASERASLIAVISLGNAQQYLWFGHHAQLDIPMQALVLAALWLTSRAVKSDRLMPYVLPGIALGLALLVKAFQGLYVVPMIVGMIIVMTDRKRFAKVVIVGVAALLVALPWYLLIISRESVYLSDYSLLVGKISSGAYDQNAHSWWYYLNQLVIAVPLFIPLLLFLPRVSQLAGHRRKMLILSLGWLALMILLLTVMGTKMLHFVPFAIIPSVVAMPLLSDDFAAAIRKRSVNFLLLLLGIVCVLWSSSLAVRNPSLYLNHQIQENFLLLASIVLPLVLIGVLMTRSVSLPVRGFVLLLSVIVGGNLYRWSHWHNSAFVHGAHETAALLDSLPNTSSLLLLQSGAEFEDLHAELSYYTGGWSLGWRPDKYYRSRTWFKAIDSLSQPAFFAADAVVIQRPWDAFARVPEKDSLALRQADSALRTHFIHYRRFVRYEVYY